jgi:tRNA(Ile2)-agmatinylcytidine synthase
VQLHIGLDDTDSPKGGCTTYIAARLVEALTAKQIRFVDYPNIIRLNPNIPYKTRGNAAVALRIEIRDKDYNTIQEMILEELEAQSRIRDAGTDPAAVFLEGMPSFRLRSLSEKALWTIVTPGEALKEIKRSGCEAVAYGNKLGVVGAMAAIGQLLDHDHTFELIAYRAKENCGTERRVDEASVRKMDRLTAPLTFNNYDYENKRVLITPHGPDPVLMGIRGETAKAVLRAFRTVKSYEPVERWVIFRTNHGTNAHLQQVPRATKILPYSSAVVNGVVAGKPHITRGGHVFFPLRFGRSAAECAAFEPTGRFRHLVASLLPGDRVTVYGGVKEPNSNGVFTINLEKIRVNELVAKSHTRNPFCPKCRARMKSAGRAKGLKCDKCSFRSRALAKQTLVEPRSIKAVTYLPASKAHRHLTKPLQRYGRERPEANPQPPSGLWHYP